MITATASSFLRVTMMIALAGDIGQGDWLTFSGDPQRTGWARNEDQITKQNANKLKVQWKIALDSPAKEMTGPTVPVIIEKVFTSNQVRDIVLVAGASDDLFAVDSDTGKMLWKRHFLAEGKSRNQSSWACPSALNATPVIDKKSKTVYVISSDGKLYSINVVNGEDRQPPLPFVPPFSKNWSLNLSDDMLYTTISQGCNGAKSGVYSVNLSKPERPITFFQASTAGAAIWGRGGASIGFSRRLFLATGDGPFDPELHKMADSVIALDAMTLQMVDYYTPANRAWLTRKDLDIGNVSPVVFRVMEREIVAAAGKEGVIYLMDAASLGGADHRLPLFRSPQYANEANDFSRNGFWGALSTWTDRDGVRWLFAPAWGPPSPKTKFALTNGPVPRGSVMAFKVEEGEGNVRLVPSWISGDISVPEPVVIANGLVFALGNGADERQVDPSGRIYTSNDRASHPSGNATLYVLDAASGKQLYSSGSTIPGWTHFGGLALSYGRVYVVTHDSILYAFGLDDS